MPPRSVYIHIPFCSKKCYYCDFTAYRMDQQLVDKYLSALHEEIKLWTRVVPPGTIDTIYIGGGTPTVLTPAQMQHLLQAIHTSFPQLSPAYEWTVEANPESTTKDLLAVFKEGGVNRISFGAQTFHPRLLRTIGRAHGVEEILQSVTWAREAGIENISLDLMFGLPKQTLTDVEETLKRVIELRPKHISAYGLKIEEDTRFYHLDQQGKLSLPTDDEEAEMYQLIRRRLQQAGYLQYEISNFALPGYESLHNSTYWLNEEYYGLGVGAHGYIDEVRYANHTGIPSYIESVKSGNRPMDHEHPVSLTESMENFMILGLRLLQGVKKDRFAKRYGKTIEKVFGSVIESLIKQKLIEDQNGAISLTEKGLLLGNEVFASFLLDAH